jgi:hypothetical protein
VSNVAQREACQACMKADAASSLEVCLYMAVHQDYPVTHPTAPRSLTYS